MAEVIEPKTQQNYDKLKSCIDALSQDFDKFQSKNVKASGQRVRANLLDCKKLCDILRKQILVEIKSIPVKHRIAGASLPKQTHPKGAGAGAKEVEKQKEVEIPQVQPSATEDKIIKVIDLMGIKTTMEINPVAVEAEKTKNEEVMKCIVEACKPSLPSCEATFLKETKETKGAKVAKRTRKSNKSKK